MLHNTVIIGFGEAGQAFASSGMRAFDRKTLDPATRAAKWADYRRCSVQGEASANDALQGAAAVLCLVTADQALAAARDCAPLLERGALWFDMNSVAPGTKRAAAAAIEAAGGCYVDVAVMSPVAPARREVPLFLAGPHSAQAAEILGRLGFGRVAVAGPRTGDAAAIKMIRSVMVKGLEALTAECLLAAKRANVADAVLRSLDASWAEQPWATRADYNLDRMLVHGIRRAAEMEEVAITLIDLGVEPLMTRGTIRRLQDLGELGIPAPKGLAAKLEAILASQTDMVA